MSSNFGSDANPKVGWHIDPSGHSTVTGGIFAEIGFDAFGINRISYDTLTERQNNKDLEFIWDGSKSLGENGYIFVHILDNGTYCTPDPIKFDKMNGEKTVYINTDKQLPTYGLNYIQIAEQFMSMVRYRLQWFRHNIKLITFGCDFRHQNAYQTMIQMDKLINYLNSNKTYNATVMYSNFYDYILDIHSLNLTWPVEAAEFFGYQKSPHTWRSGMYTSSAKLKLYIRTQANILRCAEQFYTWAKQLNLNINYQQAMNNITKFRRAEGVAQHHDAITGTEKQFVTNDYMEMLGNGTIDSIYLMNDVISDILSNKQKPNLIEGFELIPQLTTNNLLVMVLYNSLPWSIDQIIRVPLNRSDVVVYDEDGEIIQSQINIMSNESQIYEYPSKYQIFIYIKNLLPLGFTTYFIGIDPTKAVVGKIINGQYTMGKGYYSVTFDENSGLLKSITNNELKKTFGVINKWQQWIPASGNGGTGGNYSDASERQIFPDSNQYCFRPAATNRWALKGIGSGTVQQQTAIFKIKTETNSPEMGYVFSSHPETTKSFYIFSSKICDINIETKQFTFQLKNAVGSHWTDVVNFDYIEFDNKQINKSDRLKDKITGSVLINKPTKQSITLTIRFNKTFSGLPIFVSSIRGSNCHDTSEYSTVISQITNSEVQLFISRIDNKEWSESVHLDWIAWENDPTKNKPTDTFGQTVIDCNVQNENEMIEIPIKSSNYWVNEPVILFSVQQLSPQPTNENSIFFNVISLVGNSNESFSLNIKSFTQIKTGETVKLNIMWWAFERENLIENVTDNKPINTFITGPLIDEIQQIFKHNYGQSFHLININTSESKDLNYINSDIHLGPIDTQAEVISKFTTNLTEANWNKSFPIWYTNQASLEYVKRTFNPYVNEVVPANYYPCSSSAYMSDINDIYRFSTIIDHAHGCGSHQHGEYELMLKRRTVAKDVEIDQSLNCSDHIESNMRILMDTSQSVSFLNRRLYQTQQFPPVLFFGITTGSINEWKSNYKTQWTVMNNKKPLPDNIFMTQIRYGYSGREMNADILLQLENMFEKNEASKYGKINTTINVNQIFDPIILNITNVTQMTLTANIPLTKLNRLEWIAEDEYGNTKIINSKEQQEKFKQIIKQEEDTMTVNMYPRAFKTFVVNQKID